MTTPLVSLSIAARMTLNMHNLNNEGGEGNHIQTRMIDIIGEDHKLHNVNAISGDMLKHVQMEHLYRLAKEEKMNLCASCQRFDVNRINADDEFLKSSSKKDEEFIDQLLRYCAIDDIGGVLVTGGKRSIKRKSVCEFGWVAALPEFVRTESYFHAKYASELGEDKRKQDANEQQEKGSNRGQNIFHRPASSGIYALVCHLEISRIGYNDITQTYTLDTEERQRRMILLLESVLYTFLELNGAMRATQLPHLSALEGFISTSSSAQPAPLVSPLLGGSAQPFAYREQAELIARALNGIRGERIKVLPFDTVGTFAEGMRALIDSSTQQALRV